MTAPQTPVPPPPGAPVPPAAPITTTPSVAPPVPPAAPAPGAPMAGAPLPGQPALLTAPPPVAPAPKGNGCLKAFAITSAILLLLGVAGVVGLVILGNRAVDELNKSFGTAAPADYQLEIGQCSLDVTSSPIASGTITNRTNHRQAFDVKIDFVDSAGTRVAQSETWTGGIDAGQKASWQTVTFVTASNDLTCRVAEVSYSPFS